MHASGEYPNETIEALMTTRAIRRFDEREVSADDLWWCLRAAQQAPSGGNVQPVRYLVLTEPEPKRTLAHWYRAGFDRYEAATDMRATRESTSPRRQPDPARTDPTSLGDAPPARGSHERTKAAARHLANTIGAAPAIVVFLMPVMQWGATDAEGQVDIGRLDASVYPAVQNFCVAARSLGLGTTLTTVLRVYGSEYLAAAGFDADKWEIAAVVPVGYPSGSFGVAPRRRVEIAVSWNTATQTDP